MTDFAQRIAALSPEQREKLLRELARSGQGKAAPPPPPSLPPLVPRPESFAEPFPLTDIQEAYSAGASGFLDFGTPGVNVYLEYEFLGGDEVLDRFDRALPVLVEHHPVLRLILLRDGRQRFVDPVPPVAVERRDLRGLDPAAAEARLDEARDGLRHQPNPPDRWPLFGFLAHLLDGGRVRLHVRFDARLLDGISRHLLLRDLFLLLEDPAAPLARHACTYRDYALAWKAIRGSELYRRARAAWLERIPSLPPPPRLPLAVEPSPRIAVRYAAEIVPLLDTPSWNGLRELAARRGVTPSALLVAAYAEVIRTWSRDPAFLLGLEGTYWPPVHPDLREIVGNFNTILVLRAEETGRTFGERATAVQAQLTDALEHRPFSGFEVLREIRRQRGGGTAALLPIHFNSLVEYAHRNYNQESVVESRREIDLRSQALHLDINPPQLLLMPVAFQTDDGQLLCRYKVVEGIFPPGVAEGIRDAFVSLLRHLAAGEATWDGPVPRLTPAAQLAARRSPGTPQADPADDAARELAGRLELSAADCVLSLAPEGSDLALLIARAAGAFGARMLRPEPPEGAEAWAALAAKATVWSGPPYLLDRLESTLSERAADALRLAVLGPGAIPARLPERLRRRAPGARLAAVGALRGFTRTAWTLAEIEDSLPASGHPPVGRVLAGASLRVLDHHREPRPDWVEGNLYLGGEPPDATGLLGRHLPESGVEVLGPRAEHAMVIEGCEVDLRRVEAELERHPAVRAAVVGAIADVRGRRRLVAWLQPEPGRQATDDELSSQLTANGPYAWVPARFTWIETVPLTPAGEVDREALPPWEPLSATEAPAGPLECEIAGLCAEILGLPAVESQEDFFELGGSSFLAVLLLSRLRERFGEGVDLTSFFYEPTARHLARRLKETGVEKLP